MFKMRIKQKHIGTQLGNPGQKYKFIKKMSEGSASTIYEAQLKENKGKVVMKRIHKSEEWKNEHSILEYIKKFKSPSLVKLLEVFETPRFIYIITEMYNGLDLYEHIDANVPYPIEYGKLLIREMALCIARCHTIGIAHLDIKCENFIMLDPVPIPKLVLIDFGHAERVPQDEFRVGYSRYGTSCYLCPEGYRYIYSTKSDIWSLGVCMHIILTGKFPFKKGHHRAYLDKRKDTIKISNKLPIDAQNLIKDCLCINPTERISIKNIIASNFLKT